MMKRFLLLIALLGSLLLAGCSLFTEEPPTPPPAPQKISFTVYRATVDDMEKLVAEQITMEANEQSPAENALRALLYTQPADKTMYSVFPENIRLLDFKVDTKGTAYVNFGKEIVKKGQGSYNEIMLTGALVNTLTEFPEIKRVQLLVEGERVVTLSGHLDVEEPLERNETLLKK